MGLGNIPASAIDEPIEGNKMQRTVTNYNEILLPRCRGDRRKKRIIEVAGFLVGRRLRLHSFQIRRDQGFDALFVGERHDARIRS